MILIIFQLALNNRLMWLVTLGFTCYLIIYKRSFYFLGDELWIYDILRGSRGYIHKDSVPLFPKPKNILPCFGDGLVINIWYLECTLCVCVVSLERIYVCFIQQHKDVEPGVLTWIIKRKRFMWNTLLVFTPRASLV